MIAAADEGRKRILVVEDEWLIADELTIMLGKLGFDVLGPVPRSDDALTLIASHPPDGAVLDISLDRHLSFPVAEELERRKIPYLFLTGHTVSDIPAQFRSAPLLHKPVTLEALGAKIHAIAG